MKAKISADEDNIGIPDLVAAVTIAAAAGLMHGFAGVGSGMLMAPFLYIFLGQSRRLEFILLFEIVATA